MDCKKDSVKSFIETNHTKVLQKLIILNEKVLMLLNINISKKIEKSFSENRND